MELQGQQYVNFQIKFNLVKWLPTLKYSNFGNSLKYTHLKKLQKLIYKKY